MNFSGLSANRFWGKLLRLPLKLLPSHMVMPIWQGRLKGRKWIVGSSNHGCYLGSYEYEKRLLFESVVKEGGVVWDVGAHVGFYSLLASILVGPAGRVVAFEPWPENIVYLKKHLYLNRLENVTVVEKAVSDCTGEAWFQEGSSRSTGHLSPQGTLKVKTIRLDDFVQENPALAPDYLKIDVEGAELAVLAGAEKLLADFRPTIFLATMAGKFTGDAAISFGPGATPCLPSAPRTWKILTKFSGSPPKTPNQENRFKVLR